MAETGPGARALSVGQEALWFLYWMAPESPAYNVQAALRIHGPLDAGRVRRALRTVVERHDVLRSTFADTPAGPRRLVGEPESVTLQVREPPAVTGASQINKVVREFGDTPFDLTGEGTCRALLLKLAPEDAVLVLSTHHIVTDATSQWLLLQELLDAYAADGAAPPAPLKRGYDDYVTQEQGLLAGPRRKELQKFWQEFTDGAVAAELLPDRPRGEDRPGVFNGATCELRIPDELLPKLRETARRSGVTGFALLLGVFQTLVHRYTGRTDFLIGCPTTTRSGPGMRQVVGYLVNTLVLPARFTASTTFADAAGQAQRQVMSAMKHIGYPYALLAGEDRYGSRNPPVRMAFTMVAPSRLEPLLQQVTEAAAHGTSTEYGGLSVGLVDVPQLEGQFDISVEMRQSASSLTAVFRYATDLFDEGTVRRLLDHYVHLLTAAVADIDGPVSAPALVDTSELDALLTLGAADDW
ncbi:MULTISPECIES: condensation domain-containing protein [Streptomyces]|uniref:condensation domain-containing protein n=1 Tax=Streptomyces TaxID=1883 RepID=UPI001C849FBB|nr:MULTISPECIES: condensation domain-containing protein [unclassified Streptomyces]MCX2922847.1 condensation domain-containing protein [Streptomyces sp. NEAU-W12]